MTPDEERELKEILYLLLEKVRATKAALYLAEEGGSFRLATHYGFGRADRLADRVGRMDPLATAVYEHREPRFINDPRLAGKLAEMMEGAASTRILTAPLYIDGRIAGILDIRDKAGREPFGADDVAWVQEVLRRLAVRARSQIRSAPASLEDSGAFELGSGHVPGTRGTSGLEPSAFAPRADGMELVSVRDSTFVPGRGGLVPASAFAPDLPTGHLPSLTARAQQLVDETLGGAGRRASAAAAGGPSPREATFQRLFLETLLLLDDVEAAALTHVTPGRADARLLSARDPGEELEAALFENVEKVVVRSAARFPMPASRRLASERVASDGAPPPLSRRDVGAIQSSVLAASPREVQVLSLLFRPGDGDARDGLKTVHLLVKDALLEISSSARYRESYRGLVNKLLEPGLKKFAALKAHSFNVGRMARRFAVYLKLGHVEIEQITVAGILHDIGMKELNYDEIYAKRTLTEEELKLAREHPRVGAFLLEEVAWPYPVVPLVKHHHERWDGAGYPENLRAEQIPFGARAIHLCEAFDAMTSPTSYRSVLGVPEALEIIASKGGTQFDPELAPAFRSFVEETKSR